MPYHSESADSQHSLRSLRWTLYPRTRLFDTPLPEGRGFFLASTRNAGFRQTLQELSFLGPLGSWGLVILSRCSNFGDLQP